MLKAVKTEERGILQFFYSLIKLQKKKKKTFFHIHIMG